MELNIKEKIDEIVAKFKNDPELLKKFKEDPIKTIEGIIGVDLPDEQLKGIVEGVKAKFELDKDNDGKIDIIENIGEKLGGVGDKITGIFKKD
ncbi:MAG: hypothetical protein E7233_04765 [Lachnospiraceae bacterium]|nr:hypothetical protein [Lachnospiraceae bacterium]